MNREDDLTAIMRKILQKNSEIRRFMIEGQDLKNVVLQWNILQALVAQYFNNDTPGMPAE